MGTIASQITSLTIVYSTVYSGTDKKKHQSSASLAFVWGIHWGPVNSPHKWPVTRKMFPFDDVTMNLFLLECSSFSIRTVISFNIFKFQCWRKASLRTGIMYATEKCVDSLTTVYIIYIEITTNALKHQKNSFQNEGEFPLIFVLPINTQRNKHVMIIRLKHRFGVTITCLLRFVFAWLILRVSPPIPRRHLGRGGWRLSDHSDRHIATVRVSFLQNKISLSDTKSSP